MVLVAALKIRLKFGKTCFGKLFAASLACMEDVYLARQNKYVVKGKPDELANHRYVLRNCIYS